MGSRRTLVGFAGLLGGCALFTDLDGLSEPAPVDFFAQDASVDAELEASADAPGEASPASSYASEVAADAPLLHLRLGEPSGAAGARDERGAYEGRYQGGATRGVPGLIHGDPDRAVRLDGTDGHVAIGLVPDLFVGTSPFTIEAWIAPELIDSQARWIVGREVVGPGRVGVSFLVDDRGVGLERWVGGSAARATGPLPPSRAPSHVVGTFDGKAIQVWLDGVPSSPEQSSASVPANTYPIVIGAQSGLGNGFFRGVIDEVAIYDYALPPARIMAHWVAGRPR